MLEYGITSHLKFDIRTEIQSDSLHAILCHFYMILWYTGINSTRVNTAFFRGVVILRKYNVRPKCHDKN